MDGDLYSEEGSLEKIKVKSYHELPRAGTGNIHPVRVHVHVLLRRVYCTCHQVLR